MRFGDRLLWLIAESGKSVTEVCGLAGVNPNTVYSVLEGHTRSMTLRSVMRLAAALGVSMDEITEGVTWD